MGNWSGWAGIAFRIFLSVIVVVVECVICLLALATAAMPGDSSEIIPRAIRILIGSLMIALLFLVGIWRIGR